MPHAEMPVISKWIKKLEETIKSLDKDTFFIGHSTAVGYVFKLANSLLHYKRAYLVITLGCGGIFSWRIKSV